jgi:curved DNA-binding protein CbpA
MSGVRKNEASAIVAMALAFQRSPSRLAELMRGSAALPPSVGVLLRLAGGTPPHEIDPELASLASIDELRGAALFFIEQVLFQRDADHYRLMGLPRSAAPEQIKEHHRLLMRLFHPDRGSLDDERKEQFATRTNLAYNTLRDADLRARYDETLRSPSPARMQAAQRAPVMTRRYVQQPESFFSAKVYPRLMRHLPQWVLAGTALISMAVVGAVYLFNPPVPLSSQQSDPVAERAENPVEPATAPTALAAGANPPDGMAAQFERRIADARRRVADAPAPPPDTSATVLPVRRAAKEVSKAALGQPKPVAAPLPQPVQAAPVVVAKATQARRVDAVPAVTEQKLPVSAVEKLVVAPAVNPVVVPKPVQEASRQAGPPSVPQPTTEPARPAVAAAVSASPPAEEPPAIPARPALPDPNTLMARFLDAYERGDMQACMAMLDEGMPAKPELRREYDTLFRGTDLRHIKLTGMSWSREGESIRGEGQYRSTMMRKGETVLKNQSGQVRVELVRRGGTAMINELRYTVNGRS